MMLLEMTATIVSLSAAIILAHGKPSKVWLAMILWIVGSILWFIIGFMINSTGLMVVNVGFFVIESFGLYRWLKFRNNNR